MTTSETPFVTTVTLDARLESVRSAASFVMATARARALPVANNQLFEVAVVEALNNAVEHSPEGSGRLMHCEFELDGHRLTIRVLNEAAVSPVELIVPAAVVPSADAWQEIPESGYGLHLIRAVFPDVRPITRGGLHGVEMSLTL